nr:MAG TPA: hypothetical protein [Caudoviricetes sp.]
MRRFCFVQTWKTLKATESMRYAALKRGRNE